jgi:hypothetical protein
MLIRLTLVLRLALRRSTFSLYPNLFDGRARQARNLRKVQRGLYVLLETHRRRE